MTTETAELKPDFIYRGEIYIRPVGRGVTLVDKDDRVPIDEALSNWLGIPYYVGDGSRQVEITIRDLGTAQMED